LLRILVAYPAELSEPPVQKFGEDEYLIIIDGRNFDIVFDGDQAGLGQFLAELKPEQRNKRVPQQDAETAEPSKKRRQSTRPSHPPQRYADEPRFKR